MSELQTFSQFTRDYKELCSYLTHYGTFPGWWLQITFP